MKPPIIVVTVITARPAHRIAVTAALKNAVSLARKEPGCEYCGLYRVRDDRDRLMMVKQWQGEEDLKRHEQGLAFRELMTELQGCVDLSVSKLEQLI